MPRSTSQTIQAEILAIGDELTSGQRLDTNTQWISGHLNELGINVAFHTTVGDDMNRMVSAFAIAVSRSNVVICTGGLGPTADDLTRQAISQLTGCVLVLDEESLRHIRDLFKRRKRVMMDSNRIQAHFPKGAEVIANRHGTAPGFAIRLPLANSSPGDSCLMIVLPGVPAELHEMWAECVEPILKRDFQFQETIFHHTIHCFGKGESEIESLIPDLIARNREPLVGITASMGTISLRIQARASSRQAFLTKIGSTLQQINHGIGELQFGENGQTLQDIVIESLAKMNWTIAIVDIGNHGLVGNWLSAADLSKQILLGAVTVPSESKLATWMPTFGISSDRETSLKVLAAQFATQFNATIGVAYLVGFPSDGGNPGDFEIVLAMHGLDPEPRIERFVSGGHPSIREDRIAKWILNQLRLVLRH